MKVFAFSAYPFIMKKYQSMFDTLIEEEKITQIEIDVLAFLYNNPEYQHAQDIVNIRGISKAHTSIAIEKLVKKGYLSRIPDSTNRRCNILKIETKAMPLVKKIRKIQDQYNEALHQSVSKEDLEIYDKVLYQMYINLGGQKYE